MDIGIHKPDLDKLIQTATPLSDTISPDDHKQIKALIGFISSDFFQTSETLSLKSVSSICYASRYYLETGEEVRSLGVVESAQLDVARVSGYMAELSDMLADQHADYSPEDIKGDLALVLSSAISCIFNIAEVCNIDLNEALKVNLTLASVDYISDNTSQPTASSTTPKPPL